MFLDLVTLIITVYIRIEILCLSFSAQTLRYYKIRFKHNVTSKLLSNRDFSQTRTFGYQTYLCAHHYSYTTRTALICVPHAPGGLSIISNSLFIASELFKP